jgi:hypothetical protein
VFEEAKGALKLANRYVPVLRIMCGDVLDHDSAADVRARRTILFLDEIHRFTKAQQDIFLRQ